MMRGGEISKADRLKYSRKLRSWLTQHSPPQQDSSELGHHLGDIREACSTLCSLLNELPQTDPNTEEGRRHLARLTGEMFEHLASHLRAAKRPTVKLLKHHYRSADARGEL